MTRESRLDHRSVDFAALYMALELSQKLWKVAFHDGKRRRGRLVNVAAGDFERLGEVISTAMRRFNLEAGTPIYCCYEAGRDGFWIHRALTALGIENVVVDASSIEMPRRKRKAKTDRLDAVNLVFKLMRYLQGDRRVWAVVRVPTVEEEDRRHLYRELAQLKRERVRHRNRIQALAALHGVVIRPGRSFQRDLDEARQWDDEPLPHHVVARLQRDRRRLLEVEAQIGELVEERKQLLEKRPNPAVAKAHALMQVRGIGVESAWLFGLEFFGWRTFRNRREVAAAAGLCPTPHQSGGLDREQGISKGGNKRVRTMIVELAWLWLRYQPESALSEWFRDRFGGTNKRSRRIGATALARKLLIALWKYVEFGVVPEGAIITTH